ncbi:carotenoid 1,2-hydratase [Alteromonas pelagimontana]|uniref:Carotenoid 1,2-hydratase n=1 Tax=Alteromonas pelagimontana TaxID=1858656 RepID=A0A6M4MFZ3_9ALTE|nr:lipocalin-like domain-containing protein [Alteromonas pelagimontana]QJR82003.1 carotenoid 1,2-hydratase [Alteromonas pelagimontana]
MWIKNTLTFIALAWLIGGCTPSGEPSSEKPFFARAGEVNKDASEVSLSRPMQLPADHKSHADYRLEWWYLTANLEDSDGAFFGVQFTLFRIQNSSVQNNWENGQTWMAHASLHSQSKHWFEERFARGGVGNAAVETSPFQLYLDDWQWSASAENAPFPATLSFTVEDNATLQLSLTSEGPYVLHGNQGISQKSADASLRSYYYSQPFIELGGTINVNGKSHSVQGRGWFDHEWTSHLARQEALGWDWFSLHLDNGKKLMAFRMHVKDNPPYITASVIEESGNVTHLTSEEIALEVVANEQIGARRVPVQWHMAIPSQNIDIRIAPKKSQQWNQATFSYYEGAVSVKGNHTGEGFMELTGY